jgi:hypothetical protein
MSLAGDTDVSVSEMLALEVGTPMAESKTSETKTVTLDLDTLKALIASEAKALILQAQAEGAAKGDDFSEQMKLVRGGDRPADPISYEDCVSPLTGAAFRAKIQTSRTSKQGRVIDLVDYTYPDKIDVPQSQGGLMPDAHISAPPEKHAHWKYWEYLRRDMNEFASGKLFTGYITKAEHDRRVAMAAKASAA